MSSFRSDVISNHYLARTETDISTSSRIFVRRVVLLCPAQVIHCQPSVARWKNTLTLNLMPQSRDVMQIGLLAGMAARRLSVEKPMIRSVFWSCQVMSGSMIATGRCVAYLYLAAD